MTPLILAIKKGNVEVVHALLAAGANKEARQSWVGQWEGKGQHRGGVDWGVHEID